MAEFDDNSLTALGDDAAPLVFSVVGSTPLAAALCELASSSGMSVVEPDQPGVNFIIVTCIEDEACARELLVDVAQHASPEVVIAMTTSTLALEELASVVPIPALVCGLHFFTPVDRTKVVELVSGLRTSTVALERARQFADKIEVAVVETPDRPGYLVDRLHVPYLNDVIQAFDDGLASAADIDLALRLGLGYPVGPLEYLDAMGLDVHARRTTNLHQSLPNDEFAPPALLLRLVSAGWTGDSAGRGISTMNQE